MNRYDRNALTVLFVPAIAAFFIVAGFSMPRSNGKALEPDATATSTVILSQVFTATVGVIPSATELMAGQTLSVTVSITVSEGCVFPIYELTLSQHGDDAPIFEYVDPPTDTVGPPVSNPFTFSLAAVSTGTVTFNALAYGERYCGDYWNWRYLSGESEPVEVVSSPPNLTYLPLVVRNWSSPATIGNVVITDIFYDGVKGSQEPDEYVEIRNDDTQPILLEGWTLEDDASSPAVFTFPNYVMQPSQTCRIYTNEDHPEWCGFSYGSDSAIWDNSGDTAYLRDSTETLIDTYTYPGPGLIIQGHVWLNQEGGPGLANVNIYRRFASYPGVLVATTDVDGYYQSDFTYIPGDEMVTVWAELEGYTFDPEQYYWRHYYGPESRTLNFIAKMDSSLALRSNDKGEHLPLSRLDPVRGRRCAIHWNQQP